jgi:NAD dependent epimerase/dehydratase
MKPLNESSLLITGAGGFIGSHLTEALASQCPDVTALIHYDSRPHWGNLEYLPNDIKKSITVVAGDITDPHFMRHIIHGKDYVFHLAALIAIPFSYVAPAAYFTTNVLGTINVLEACRQEQVQRLICTSTSECYGTAMTVPISEDHPLQAQSPYSASKISADKAAESFYLSFDLPVVTVRPFNTYGPRQSARAVLPTIITQVLSDSTTIKLGSLTPTRDLTYASDTAHGFIAAAVADGVDGETVNLGVGETISIGDLVQRIFRLTNIEKDIECDENRIRPEKSEVMQLISDNSKAKRILNWEPRIDLDTGLLHMIDFIKKNPDFYKVGQYTL